MAMLKPLFIILYLFTLHVQLNNANLLEDLLSGLSNSVLRNDYVANTNNSSESSALSTNSILRNTPSNTSASSSVNYTPQNYSFTGFLNNLLPPFPGFTRPGSSRPPTGGNVNPPSIFGGGFPFGFPFGSSNTPSRPITPVRNNTSTPTINNNTVSQSSGTNLFTSSSAPSNLFNYTSSTQNSGSLREQSNSTTTANHTNLVDSGLAASFNFLENASTLNPASDLSINNSTPNSLTVNEPGNTLLPNSLNNANTQNTSSYLINNICVPSSDIVTEASPSDLINNYLTFDDDYNSDVFNDVISPLDSQTQSSTFNFGKILPSAYPVTPSLNIKTVTESSNPNVISNIQSSTRRSDIFNLFGPLQNELPSNTREESSIFNFGNILPTFATPTVNNTSVADEESSIFNFGNILPTFIPPKVTSASGSPSVRNSSSSSSILDAGNIIPVALNNIQSSTAKSDIFNLFGSSQSEVPSNTKEESSIFNFGNIMPPFSTPNATNITTSTSIRNSSSSSSIFNIGTSLPSVNLSVPPLTPNTINQVQSSDIFNLFGSSQNELPSNTKQESSIFNFGNILPTFVTPNITNNTILTSIRNASSSSTIFNLGNILPTVNLSLPSLPINSVTEKSNYIDNVQSSTRRSDIFNFFGTDQNELPNSTGEENSIFNFGNIFPPFIIPNITTSASNSSSTSSIFDLVTNIQPPPLTSSLFNLSFNPFEASPLNNLSTQSSLFGLPNLFNTSSFDIGNANLLNSSFSLNLLPDGLSDVIPNLLNTPFPGLFSNASLNSSLPDLFSSILSPETPLLNILNISLPHANTSDTLFADLIGNILNTTELSTGLSAFGGILSDNHNLTGDPLSLINDIFNHSSMANVSFASMFNSSLLNPGSLINLLNTTVFSGNVSQNPLDLFGINDLNNINLHNANLSINFVFDLLNNALHSSSSSEKPLLSVINSTLYNLNLTQDHLSIFGNNSLLTLLNTTLHNSNFSENSQSLITFLLNATSIRHNTNVSLNIADLLNNITSGNSLTTLLNNTLHKILDGNQQIPLLNLTQHSIFNHTMSAGNTTQSLLSIMNTFLTENPVITMIQNLISLVQNIVQRIMSIITNTFTYVIDNSNTIPVQLINMILQVCNFFVNAFSFLIHVFSLLLNLLNISLTASNMHHTLLNNSFNIIRNMSHNYFINTSNSSLTQNIVSPITQNFSHDNPLSNLLHALVSNLLSQYHISHTLSSVLSFYDIFSSAINHMNKYSIERVLTHLFSENPIVKVVNTLRNIASIISSIIDVLMNYNPVTLITRFIINIFNNTMELFNHPLSQNLFAAESLFTNPISYIFNHTLRQNPISNIISGILNPNNVFTSDTNDNTVVRIPFLGRVSGLRKRFENSDRNYYQYKGIPYAEPADRFTISQAKRPWFGEHNGTIEGKSCPQLGGHIMYDGTDERNCLILTVTTPQNPNQQLEKLPVLVFYYGGGFQFGSTSTSLYDPEPLVLENIIVVQVQYRLGVFGWLTEGNVIPKNIGLKDCLLGLQWVNRNIAAFGGNPKRVTIYGTSAGAIITSNLWQSPKTVGLINGAILQSGTSINHISYQSNPQEAFRKFVKSTPCAPSLLLSRNAQVACLRLLPANSLSISNFASLFWSDVLSLGFVHGLTAGIVLEDSADLNAIVTSPPLDYLTNGSLPRNVPVMLTITSEEALSFAPLIQIMRLQSNSGLVPAGMRASTPDEVGKLIKSHYGGNEIGFSLAAASTITRLVSDYSFNNAIRKFIDITQPRGIPVYCMMFNYSSPMGIFHTSNRVGHTDDVIYNWKMEKISFESKRRFFYPPEAFQKRLQLNRMFANFVKTGNPTPTFDNQLSNMIWPRVTDLQNVKCLHFNRNLTLINNMKQENYEFWNDLYRRYAHNPYTF